MNRQFGAALTLSVLGHGGAVAVIATLGAAWLASAPPLAPPPPLYVDLVHPVVTTSERAAAPDGAEPRLRGARPRTPVGAVTPRASFDAAPAPAGATIAPSASVAPPAKAVSPGVDVARPPTPPVAPKIPASPPESMQLTFPTPETPSPPALPATPMPSSDATSTTRSVADDRSSGASRPPAAVALVPADSEARVDDQPARSTFAMAGPHANGGAGGEQLGATASEARERGGAVAPGPPGSPAAGVGTSLAGLTPGEGPAGSVADGAVPPEYDAYVRAFRERVQQRLVYPWTAVRRGLQGVVELELRLAPDGRLMAVEVVAGASADTLRVAAVAAVRGAAPFPFPPGLAARPLVIRLPVEFRLR